MTRGERVLSYHASNGPTSNSSKTYMYVESPGSFKNCQSLRNSEETSLGSIPIVNFFFKKQMPPDDSTRTRVENSRNQTGGSQILGLRTIVWKAC